MPDLNIHVYFVSVNERKSEEENSDLDPSEFHVYANDRVVIATHHMN